MIIDVNPEFGYELACSIPYAHYLHKKNKLEKVITCKGMKPFYYFCDNVEEKYDSRNIDNRSNGVQNLPNNWIHHNAEAVLGKKMSELPPEEQIKGNGVLDYREWSPPPYREHYANNQFKYDKPFVVLSNRYNFEHGQPPLGFFTIECLYEIFNYFKEKDYYVVYKRPKNNEFALDMNEIMALQSNYNDINADVEGIGNITDFELCNYYDNVLLLDDIVKEGGLSYNETQLKLFSNSSGFISMGGGSGIFCSYFKVPNITYLHTSGEIRENYFNENCYYRKLSNANIYPVVDKNEDIIKRGKADFSELYRLMGEVL